MKMNKLDLRNLCSHYLSQISCNLNISPKNQINNINNETKLGLNTPNSELINQSRSSTTSTDSALQLSPNGYNFKDNLQILENSPFKSINETVNSHHDINLNNLNNINNLSSTDIQDLINLITLLEKENKINEINLLNKIEKRTAATTNIDKKRYKTEMCRKYLTNPGNHCEYGDKCQYAHGIFYS